MFTGETFTVSLDVAWTGVGDTAYIRRHSQIKKSGFMLNSNGSIAMRGCRRYRYGHDAMGQCDAGTVQQSPDVVGK
jgi:hypothetical protein